MYVQYRIEMHVIASCDTGNPIYLSYYFLFLSVSLCAPLISVILWIGDLNYRIGDLDVDSVKELISKKDFETLHNYDQVILISLFFSFFLIAQTNHLCS